VARVGRGIDQPKYFSTLSTSTYGGLGQPMADLGKTSGGHLNRQAASPGEVEKGIAEVLA